MSGSEVGALGAEATPGPAHSEGVAGQGQTPFGTHRLALLQHRKHKEDISVAGLQAPVVEAPVLLLVAGVEGGRQHGEASRDVGTGRLQLA